MKNSCIRYFILSSLLILIQQQQVQADESFQQSHQEQVKLNQAIELWNSYNTTEYCCHIRTEAKYYNITFGLQIQDEQIISSISNINTTNTFGWQVPTISTLFQKIQKAINSHTSAHVTVTYHSIYGYPINFHLDYGDQHGGFLFFSDTMRGSVESFIPVSEELQKLYHAKNNMWDRLVPSLPSSSSSLVSSSYDTIYNLYPNYQQQLSVSVRDNQVVQVLVDEQDETDVFFINTNTNHRLFLIDKQWIELETILTKNKPTKFNVGYNPTLGYPQHVQIDFAKYDGTNNEIEYSIQTLTPVSTTTSTSTGGGSNSNNREKQEEYTVAYEKWTSKSIIHYSMKIQKFCGNNNCDYETQRPMLAIVQYGTVQSITYLDDGTTKEKDNNNNNWVGDTVESIEQLFQAITNAITSLNMYGIAVRYNDMYGYPETVSLDYTIQSGDEILVHVHLLDIYDDDGNIRRPSSSPSSLPITTPTLAPTIIIPVSTIPPTITPLNGNNNSGSGGDRSGGTPSSSICVDRFQPCQNLSGDTCCNPSDICRSVCRPGPIGTSKESVKLSGNRVNAYYNQNRRNNNSNRRNLRGL